MKSFSLRGFFSRAGFMDGYNKWLEPYVLCDELLVAAKNEIRMWNEVSGVIPNRYSIHISKDDLDFFYNEYIHDTRERAEKVIRDYAAEAEDFVLREPVRIDIVSDEDLMLGELRIHASFSAGGEMSTSTSKPRSFTASSGQGQPVCDAWKSESLSEPAHTEKLDGHQRTEPYEQDIEPITAMEGRSDEVLTVGADDPVDGVEQSNSEGATTASHRAQIIIGDDGWMISSLKTKTSDAKNDVSLERDGEFIELIGTVSVLLQENDIIHLFGEAFCFEKVDLAETAASACPE